VAKNVDQLLNELADLQKKVQVDHIPINQLTQPWSKELVIFLSCLILVFGLLVLFIMAFLVIKGKEADQILRICALPLIIVTAIFLVVTGYTNEQISPVMGLLGAIAGYLLGAKKTSDSAPAAPQSQSGDKIVNK
jgi:hypothetical protein